MWRHSHRVTFAVAAVWQARVTAFAEYYRLAGFAVEIICSEFFVEIFSIFAFTKSFGADIL